MSVIRQALAARYANKYSKQIAAGADFNKILDFKKPGPLAGQWGSGPYPNVMSDQEVGQLAAASQMKLFDTYGRTVNVAGQPIYKTPDGQIVDSWGNLSSFSGIDPWNFRDTQFKIHPREIERIDRVVARVLRVVSVAPRLFRTVFNGKGNVEYKHFENVDAADPMMSKDFEIFEPGLEAFEQETAHLLAVSKDYKIGMVKFDQSRLSNLLPSSIIDRTVSEFTAMVADFKERMIWRGGDIRTRNTGNSNIDARVTGLATSAKLNNIGVLQTTAVAGSITTIGDIAKAFIELATPLISAPFPGPFNFVVTTGVVLQAMKNRHATSDKTDLMNAATLGMEKFGIPIVKSITYTPHLLKVAEANANQAIYCYAPMDQSGRANQVIAEAYPAWHRPLPLALTFGVAGKIGWYGAGVVRREDSATFTEGVTVDVYA